MPSGVEHATGCSGAEFVAARSRMLAERWGAHLRAIAAHKRFPESCDTATRFAMLRAARVLDVRNGEPEPYDVAHPDNQTMRAVPEHPTDAVTAIDPALASLARALRAIGRSFSLHFVRCPLAAREPLQRELSKLRALEGVPLFCFIDPGERGSAIVSTLLDGAPQIDGVVLLDGAALLEDDAAPLQALNLARDRLPLFCHGPLVIVLTDDALTDVARLAPDLYSVRSTVSAYVPAAPVEPDPSAVSPPR